MKLPIVLYIVLAFFNLLCLYFIICLFGWYGIGDVYMDRHLTGQARFIAYLFYITVLLNLYALFYMAIRKIFEE